MTPTSRPYQRAANLDAVDENPSQTGGDGEERDR
jgi:hypothetical protein